jgi:hypothetical protein
LSQIWIDYIIIAPCSHSAPIKLATGKPQPACTVAVPVAVQRDCIAGLTLGWIFVG